MRALRQVLVGFIVCTVVVLLTGCDVPCVGGLCLLGAPRPTGTTPNDVVLVRCGDVRTALVPASADGRLDAIGVDIDTDTGGVFLGVGTQPWAVAAVSGTAVQAVVTLFGSHEVALLDPCAGIVLARVVDEELLPLSAPAVLREAIDADGDGVASRTVDAMLPRAPEAVVVVGRRAFVSYTNVLELSDRPGARPTLGPGTIGVFDIGDSSLQQIARVVLPCDNPQGLAVDEEGARVVASCSGVLGIGDDGRVRQLSPGGIAVVDVETLTLLWAMELEGAAFGTPHVVNDDIVVGDLLAPRVRTFTMLAPSQRVFERSLVTTDVTDSVFSITARHGTLLAPVFAHDLIVADPFAPEPRTLVARHTATLPRGLMKIAHDDDGAVLLFSLAAEIVPFDVDAWLLADSAEQQP